VLALLLALVAWPLVASTMGVGFRSEMINTGVPEPAPVQWTAAAAGVFLSALVAGPIGGLLVRRNAIAGCMFTFVLALTVAIPAATLLPVFLGQENVCHVANIGSPCDPITATAQVIIDDLQSLPLLFLFAPLVQPVAVLTLALGVGVWTTVLTRLRAAPGPTLAMPAPPSLSLPLWTMNVVMLGSSPQPRSRTSTPAAIRSRAEGILSAVETVLAHSQNLRHDGLVVCSLIRRSPQESATAARYW
jgi:hypothetical protein